MIGVWQKASHKRAMIRMRKLRVFCTASTARETIEVGYPVYECSKRAHLCTQRKTYIAQK